MYASPLVPIPIAYTLILYCIAVSAAVIGSISPPLLTPSADGVNNGGLIDPITAAETAIQYNIKVYAIGIGTKGEAYMPAYVLPDGSIKYDYLPVEIDEKLLQEIAGSTGGKYYRATDRQSLENIYEEIDLLEKTEIETSQTIRIKELFYPFAALAILFLFLEQTLRYTILRTFP